MSLKEEVLSWLEKGNDTAIRLIDLPWDITEDDEHIVLYNEHVPFQIYLVFKGNTLQIYMKTGIETAVLENTVRLSTYRTLLLLNNQVDLVKFMLTGMNEEVTARADLQTESLTKNEMNDGLNTLLSSLYLMVDALNLEDQFNKKIIERMLLMIRDFQNEGKSRDQIKGFLTAKLGIGEDDAEKILSQVMPRAGNSEPSNDMYG